MAEGMGVNGVKTPIVNTGAMPLAGEPEAPAQTLQRQVGQQQRTEHAARQATTFTTEARVAPQTESKVVQRLIQQNATLHSPGLARIPLPARPEGVPRTQPKKPAGPMVEPRVLDGGRSPLAPMYLQDARSSVDQIGARPDDTGDQAVVEDAKLGAAKLPSRHGLVAYTTNERGDKVYLTQERWLHIRENHMDQTPQPRGKRTTSYWPTKHAVNEPSMTDSQVIGVIVDTARKGTLRTEVRDTRMAEYDLPREQSDAYGVSEAKVSMAPDGLVLSAYPGAGDNVLAVYEMNAADQAELARVQAGQPAQADEADERMFRTNVAQTTFG